MSSQLGSHRVLFLLGLLLAGCTAAQVDATDNLPGPGVTSRRVAERARQENRPEARELYEEHLARYPDDLAAHTNYQRLLVALGEERHARQIYHEAHSSAPTARTALLLSKVLLDPEREELLLREFVADGRDDDRDLHLSLGWALERQGRFDEALEQYDRVKDTTALSPYTTELLLRHAPERLRAECVDGHEVGADSRGYALLRLGRLEEARPLLVQAAAQRPQDPTLQWSLALLSLLSGDDDGFVTHLAATLRIEPYAPRAIRLGSMHAIHHDDLDVALELVLEACRLQPLSSWPFGAGGAGRSPVPPGLGHLRGRGPSAPR